MKSRKVRVRNGFADSNNISPLNRTILIKDFPEDTRKVLANAVKLIINDYAYEIRGIKSDALARDIVENVFNDIYDEDKDNYWTVLDEITETILKNDYSEVLTLIQYVCNRFYESKDEYNQKAEYHDFTGKYYFSTTSYMNDIFENEYIGYRFVNGKILPITNKKEIKEIETAASSSYKLVNDSIKKASDFLSVTGKRDYKNAIKESITALENMFNIILKKEGLTLGKAVEKYASKHNLHDELKETIRHLYNYASDENGVRHGNNKSETSVTFNEAKLILMMCSSLINYLIGKGSD